jgi:hypothetical protein
MDAATPRPEPLGQYETVETLALDRKWRTYKGFDAIRRRFQKNCSKTALLHGGAGVYGHGEDYGLASLAMEHVEGRGYAAYRGA